MLAVARTHGDAAKERRALAGLCDALFFDQRLEAMSARAHELFEAASREEAEGAVAEAQARIGQALVGEGRLQEAAPRLDQAVAAGRESKTAAPHIAVVYRAFVHYWQAEYEAAEVLCVEAANLARESGDGFYTLGAWMFTGLARANLGRISEAIDDFTDATAAARRNDDSYWLPRLLSHLGWVHRELGAFEAARQYDTEALRAAEERPGWTRPATEMLLNLCLDDVREGRVEQAASSLAALEARVRESTFLKWISELRVTSAAAEYWGLRGDHERALERAASLFALAHRLGARNYSCAAARMRATAALACAHDVESAALDLESALADLQRTPAPLEAWRSARVLGDLRRHLGNEEGAREAFRESAAAIRTIAAGTRDEALRAGFLALPKVREVLANP
jgi:tetratricopeptide (TPR) repeat protein